MADDRKAIYIVRNGRLLPYPAHLGSSGGHFPAWDPASRRNTLLLRFAQLMGQHTGPSYERATPSEIIHINIKNVPGEGSLLPLMC